MNKITILHKVKTIAEGYFQRGEFFCSEAVVHTINQLLNFPFPEEITKLASGFPIGLGKSGCLCGAVSGGEIALGMVFGRKHGEPMHPEMFKLAADLHEFVKEKYGSNCCRVLVKGFEFQSPERKEHCVGITGDVAEWVALRFLEKDELKDQILSSDFVREITHEK